MSVTILFKALQVNIPVWSQDEVEDKRAVFGKAIWVVEFTEPKAEHFPYKQMGFGRNKIFKRKKQIKLLLWLD